MNNLKSLVDELVSLNDDNLAQRVIASNDVQWCLSELQDMLAAEVELVRHGRWMWDIGDVYACSRCGEKSHVKEVMEEPAWDYCPNCGARMDGTEADDATETR